MSYLILIEGTSQMCLEYQVLPPVAMMSLLVLASLTTLTTCVLML